MPGGDDAPRRLPRGVGGDPRRSMDAQTKTQRSRVGPTRAEPGQPPTPTATATIASPPPPLPPPPSPPPPPPLLGWAPHPALICMTSVEGLMQSSRVVVEIKNGAAMRQTRSFLECCWFGKRGVGAETGGGGGRMEGRTMRGGLIRLSTGDAVCFICC